MSCLRRFFLIIIINIVLAHYPLNHAAAQDQVDISSTLNPVGSGSRAMGMGGAFIGVADDATAASWNPAGLVQLEKPEISAVYSYFHRQQEYISSVHPEIAGNNTMGGNGLNYASVALPFALFNKNMVLSLNYQRLFEMNKEVRFNLNREVLGSTLTDNITFKQDGYLYAFSPAYAVEIIPELYIGGTLNIWDNTFGKNGWKSTYNSVTSGSIMGSPIEIEFTQREDVSFEGINAHLGFLWQIHKSWTLGGVYKTAFDADIEKKSFVMQAPNPPVIDTRLNIMHMPPSYGLGIAYRHSDNWTAALDAYVTEWSKFIIETETGNEINPLDGVPINEGHLKDTLQIRLGTEYLFIADYYLIPVRVGLFYDPEPAKGRLDDYYGLAIGTGYARDNFSIDIAYQYRTGNNVTGDIQSVEGSGADINQHTAMLSLIYYLDH